MVLPENLKKKKKKAWKNKDEKSLPEVALLGCQVASVEAATPHTREVEPPKNEIETSTPNVYSSIQQNSLTPDASSNLQKVPSCNACLAWETLLL